MMINNISTSGGLNHLLKLFQDETDLAEGKKADLENQIKTSSML